MSYEDYTKMEINSIRKVFGDNILVEWQENTDHMLGGKLVRPDTFKRSHHTGIVVKVGPEVQEEIQPGKRILFDQFSNPHKFYDTAKKKRFAIIRESLQGSAFAIIPARVKIGGGEPDFDYAA